MFLRFFLGYLILGICLPLHAEIYKWIDENGKVHFGDRKLNEIDQEVLVLDEFKSEWSPFDISVKSMGVNITPEEHKHIVDGVNYIYEFFDRVLYFDMYKTVPVNILILKDKKEYRKYLIKNNRSNLTSSYGVYFPKENQIIVYIREDRKGTFRTIRHEVSHAIVDTIMPYAPAWLNEGLAEQMETLGRKKSGLYIAPHKGNREIVDRAERNRNLTNISVFLKLPSSEWRHTLTNKEKSLQSQAGQFVYFLLSTPPNRSFVIRLMHEFERGNRKLSYYLVNDNYIGGAKALEVTWQNWIKNQSKDIIEFL
ncbi:DUF4124 domain-containing protein [Microbulbifer sp. JMSA003]|uniref:DUF4124 domain-containing protein n=1 Tax=unclassified Microbulbifer TaxID=2619833 RepID=UPI004039F2C2